MDRKEVSVSQRNTVPTWRKSRFCESGACVEVADIDEIVAVRDGKAPNGAMLQFTRSEWRAFVDGIRAGDFDYDPIG
jgi:Domain of unknown function (DUF397)